MTLNFDFPQFSSFFQFYKLVFFHLDPQRRGDDEQSELGRSKNADGGEEE